MKIEKFKVLLYLKKSRPDKSGKAPIMGRITVNRSMVQFSCKLSCTPDLWNPRESRLNGKSNEAVEVNAKLDKLLLSIHAAFDTLVERKMDFDAEAVKNLFQGSLETQMTLLAMTDIICEELRKRIGIDRAKGTYPAYFYTRRTLAEFIQKKFHSKDIAFGQLTEQFIHDYQSFVVDDKGLAIETCRHYLAIIKKVCRRAYKEGYADKCFFAHFSLPKQEEKTPKALSRESFEKIRDLVIPEHRTSHILARDLFLFACYTGTSYADAVSVTRDNLFTDDEGSLWLKYRRKKKRTSSLCQTPARSPRIDREIQRRYPSNTFSNAVPPQSPSPDEMPYGSRRHQGRSDLPCRKTFLRFVDYSGSRSAHRNHLQDAGTF